MAIVGGGPAGLRAAEVCVNGGSRVSVFEAKRSVGRKLLVAGYGGLNLTHGEALEHFVERYSGPDMPDSLFDSLIRQFPPNELRQWTAGLGIETFEQRTGRVYPKEMKAAPLLRRWVERLRKQGVEFHVGAKLTGLQAYPWHDRPGHESKASQLHKTEPSDPASSKIHDRDGHATNQVALSFNHAEYQTFDAAILALGGASWAKTGSDGSWTQLLEQRGIKITPFQPANSGWEANWPSKLASKIEGHPLKNIAATANHMTVRGEIMLTQYGVEAGAVYQLGPALRAMEKPTLQVDLKPQVPLEKLLRKMENVKRDFLAAGVQRLRLTEPAALLLEHSHGPFNSTAHLCQAMKALTIPLTQPRPIDEAISSAGGVAWSELDENLMLRQLPGIYTVGEMVDWEAPTGGYLIQGCFATATHAAKAALKHSNLPA